MSKVVAFQPGLMPGEPNKDIIETLDDLLAKAREGKLTGLAYAAVHIDGAQATGWDGSAGTRHPLGTSIMMLHHRYAASLLDRDD